MSKKKLLRKLIFKSPGFASMVVNDIRSFDYETEVVKVPNKLDRVETLLNKTEYEILEKYKEIPEENWGVTELLRELGYDEEYEMDLEQEYKKENK